MYENGYTNVSALLGGTAKWVEAGYPMESSAESEADAGEPSSEAQIPILRSEVPRVTVEELKERLDSGESIVIADTRSITLFNVNHIVGAISAPESEVLSQLDSVPLDQEIVLYCY